MKKHHKILLLFLLIPCLLINSINVYAYNKNWSDYVAFTGFNLLRYASLIYGAVFKDQDADAFLDKFYTYGEQAGTFHDANSMQEWYRMNFKVKKDDGTDSTDNYGDHIEFTDEFKNLLNTTINGYKADLDSQKAYTYKTTYAPSAIKPDAFLSLDDFNNTKNYITDLCKKYDYVAAFFPRHGYRSSNVTYRMLICSAFSVSQCGLVGSDLYINWQKWGQYSDSWTADNVYWKSDIFIYDLEKNSKYKFSSQSDLFVHSDTISTFLGKSINEIMLDDGANRYYYGYGIGSAAFSKIYTVDSPPPWGLLDANAVLFTSTGQKIKSFKSLQDLKQYQTNTVTYPYYMVTPTCSGNTITQSQIDNSVTYGDIDQSVTNIIINNGGITEEQLQRIIDAILAGKGGGSDPVTPVDPTDPVNPVDPTDPWVPPSFDFTGLLKGLMNLLAAIFGLISNLIGYVAELTAELVTSLNAVIDNIKALINQGVIGLLTALFPFLPPEITGLLSLTFLLISIISIIKAIRG